MNFKKLLLSKCQKQFYKMHAKEESERRSRRQSMADSDTRSQNSASNKKEQESDFNKQMLFVFDPEEIRFRQK